MLWFNTSRQQHYHSAPLLLSLLSRLGERKWDEEKKYFWVWGNGSLMKGKKRPWRKKNNNYLLVTSKWCPAIFWGHGLVTHSSCVDRQIPSQWVPPASSSPSFFFAETDITQNGVSLLSTWLNYPACVPRPLAHLGLLPLGAAGEPAPVLCHTAWLQSQNSNSAALTSDARHSIVWATLGKIAWAWPDPAKSFSRAPDW